MKQIILAIWQFPQNLLALFLLAIFIIIGKRVDYSEYKGITYVWVSDWYNGVSLGSFVFLSNEWYRQNLTVINHEYGHTRQSLIFGPLYLLLIGLPSIAWNIIDRILSKTLSSWTYGRSYKTYYSMPWEHGADVLGGVERYF